MAKKEKKEKKYKPRHAKPRTCGHTWSTRPAKNAVAGVHYDHTCGQQAHTTGKHVCNNWNCSETL